MDGLHGWRALWGSTTEALALYRITLGGILLSELLLRFRFLHPFYSDEGTHPLHILLPQVDDLFKVVCVHCQSGSVLFQQALLTIQCVAALCFTVGYKTRAATIVSWFLYLSLTLRNTWMNFILDRYFHYMLFYAMFLPLDDCWSLSKPHRRHNSMVVSVATVGLKLQVLWIYLDAGGGKYMDPLGGWTYHADPLPALDTYARHTVAARYMYALLQPAGLRLLTPTVVWVELLSAPVALLGSFVGWKDLVTVTVAIVCSLHIGIAFTVRNTVLLSLVACSAWMPFLPLSESIQTSSSTESNWNGIGKNNSGRRLQTTLSFLLIAAFAGGSLWFEIMSDQCHQTTRHIWSTLLHNRWNVFVGAEEYVTWEIAPGRLVDGSVVDVWGRRDEVSWKLPGGGAPSTSTSRPGRWRSFPYLAELEGEEGAVLWNYLCTQWDHENDVERNPGRQLVRFNFFMLQADVLPNMGFSATRKRLIYSHECPNVTAPNDGQDEETSREEL